MLDSSLGGASHLNSPQPEARDIFPLFFFVPHEVKVSQNFMISVVYFYRDNTVLLRARL